MDHMDVVVVGAGVVGLAIAREMAQLGKSVLVIEKEKSFGMSTSSRNSEVIHAGNIVLRVIVFYMTMQKHAQSRLILVENSLLPLRSKSFKSWKEFGNKVRIMACLDSIKKHKANLQKLSLH